uniref:hypothetical protein n=1 Tax=Alistipes putredinis TaxID=28117 RepID=UPI003FD717A6
FCLFISFIRFFESRVSAFGCFILDLRPQDANKPSTKANLFAFCRGEVFKTKSKIRKGGSNRAGLYARIAEPLPIFCKDNMQRHLPTTPGAGFIEL